MLFRQALHYTTDAMPRSDRSPDLGVIQELTASAVAPGNEGHRRMKGLTIESSNAWCAGIKNSGYKFRGRCLNDRVTCVVSDDPGILDTEVAGQRLSASGG